MTEFLFLGVVLGLSAGLSPGPLQTLVMAETLRFGVRAGIKVALSPVITDLPIIFLTLYIFRNVIGLADMLGLISMLGGLLVLMMGIDGLRSSPFNVGQAPSNSLARGTLANLLNPHPYLFWIGVGAPLMTRAWDQGAWILITFLLSFYIMLVGSKIVLAVLVGKSRAFMSGKVYLSVVRLLGAVLILLAFVLLYDGFSLLAGIQNR
jgi:threonine/homoserine/homoserine lactone efflux protein